jgi:hypothetical protein
MGVAAHHIGSPGCSRHGDDGTYNLGGGGGGGGEGFSFLQAPPFPSEIFAAKVFDSLGSSERLGGFVKEKKKKKPGKLHCPLLLFLMELTQSSLSPSPEKPPPNFIIK